MLSRQTTQLIGHGPRNGRDGLWIEGADLGHIVACNADLWVAAVSQNASGIH